jgi:hypothetical protein
MIDRLRSISFFFFLIKCKKYIDQKEQDKLAVQAGDQQNHYKQQQPRRTDSPGKASKSYGQIKTDKENTTCLWEQTPTKH